MPSCNRVLSVTRRSAGVGFLIAYIACLLMSNAVLVLGKDNLRIAYAWKEIDFKYENADERWTAIENREFKPNNVIPFGLEVYRSRLFVTLPRWKDGVPVTLGYLDLNDNSTKSPALVPFPSWEAHSLSESDPELVSPFRARADRCGRLWVLDSRIANVLGNTKIYGPAQLLIYDLHNDNLLRRHVFPAAQVKESSFFANLAIEDESCENAFAYAGDLGSPGLVVYSFQQDESWRVHHNYFHPDPLAGNFSIDSIEFQWDDGLYGLSLSKSGTNGYATLYFHPLSSTMEFAVSTAILRNKTLATTGDIYREFKIVGSRGMNAQAGASFLDHSTGVIFYALPNLNSVACWSIANPTYNEKSLGRVHMSPVDMVFPSDVKVDEQDRRLWVLSNRLPEFIYDELHPDAVNFRILTAPVAEAIKNTECEVKVKELPDVINKLGDVLNNVTGSFNRPKTSGSGSSALSCVAFVIAILFGSMRHWWCC